MDFWHQANGWLSLVGMGLLTCIVLHPRIHEGLVIKTGLMAMIVSLGATAWLTLAEVDNWQALWRAGFVLRAGLVGTVLGCLLRANALPRRKDHRHFLRRSSDFFGSFHG